MTAKSLWRLSIILRIMKITQAYSNCRSYMFKGAYTSKDHDISAVAVENNTKCSKISESYGCEPENFSIIWDPGKQIIPLSDSQQYSVEGAYLS
jgi:hypothetical protein